VIAHPLKVRELLDEIARGEIVLPEFQRTFVWKPSQVVALLDSLYRGYPAGQILLWDPGDLPITRALEGVEETGMQPPGRPKVVLDGQQRLTSLYKALSREPREPVEVYFDLREEAFAAQRKSMAKDPYWVGLRDVVNNTSHDLDVLQAIAAAGGPGLEDPRCRVFLERLQRVRNLAEFTFPIEVFRSSDYEAVTELFVRINAGGTRLRKAELVLAQLALRLPGVISQRFEEAVEHYETLGFALDARFFVRALVAAGTGQSRFTSLKELWGRGPEELEALWARTQSGLDRAVEFVRHTAHFESSDWLPSLNALVPLLAYFERHPKLSPRVEVGLLRWFYLVQLRGRYSVSAESAMDEDLKAVASEQPLVRLLDNVITSSRRSVGIEPEEFQDADWRNPLFPITYAIARKHGARDWFTGTPLSSGVVGSRSQVHVHPIFPKNLLRKAGVDRQQRDAVANLAFLTTQPPGGVIDQLPSTYLPALANEHVDRLRAQSVPLDPELWTVERYADFLEARQELLAAEVNDLLDDPSPAAARGDTTPAPRPIPPAPAPKQVPRSEQDTQLEL
jgi:hypothetical protein